MKLQSLFFISFILSLVSAKTHTWYYKTGWLDANPDGCYERKVIGWNDTWPLPILRVNKGDRIELYLTNGFEDANTTLHFHGLFQNGSTQMDGPEMVTQCPIPPGETFLYNFTVDDNSGTYWYHSHTGGQYQDGMRGVFIIEDDDFPYEYDEEVVLTVGEWYHDTYDVLKPSFMSLYNPTGAEPIPQNLLFNETMNGTWNVEPNTTYFLRIINTGGFVSQYLYMEDHEFTVVEVDGVFVEKNTTEMIYITTAQRYGVLLKTKENPTKNYAFMQKFDDTMLDVIPDDLVLNRTSYITYNSSWDKPDEYTVDSIDDFLDDFYLKPVDKTKLYDEADYVVTIDVVMDNLGDGVNYAFFNNITYVKPKVPTLVTAMTTGDDATNAEVYGTNINAFVLQKDDIVDIRLNNQDTGKHPFHLHGHTFQVIERHAPVDDDDSPVPFNPKDHAEYPEYPMSRDVAYVNPQSYMVLRFKADNPGVWFFHCHIEWHLTQGLAIVFIEAPAELQEEQELTQNYLDICKANNMTSGNAAANTKDFLDLTGQNVQPKALPAGFTARGIVALVFSAIGAIIGLIAIGIYGMADIKNVEQRVARDLDVDLSGDGEGDDEIEDIEHVQEASGSSIDGASHK